MTHERDANPPEDASFEAGKEYEALTPTQAVEGKTEQPGSIQMPDQVESFESPPQKTPEANEANPKPRPLIMSLVGVTGSGKSTLAIAAEKRLSSEGIDVQIIQKDEAIHALARQDYPNDEEWVAYSKASRRGNELNQYINHSIKQAIDAGKRVILLEGGTRTRTAMQTTLGDIDADYRIVKLGINPGTLVRNLRKRRKERKETDRADDKLVVMFGKVLSQAWASRSEDAPKPDDPDVAMLDASASKEALQQQLLGLIHSILNQDS